MRRAIVLGMLAWASALGAGCGSESAPGAPATNADGGSPANCDDRSRTSNSSRLVLVAQVEKVEMAVLARVWRRCPSAAVLFKGMTPKNEGSTLSHGAKGLKGVGGKAGSNDGIDGLEGDIVPAP